MTHASLALHEHICRRNQLQLRLVDYPQLPDGLNHFYFLEDLNKSKVSSFFLEINDFSLTMRPIVNQYPETCLRPSGYLQQAFVGLRGWRDMWFIPSQIHWDGVVTIVKQRQADSEMKDPEQYAKQSWTQSISSGLWYLIQNGNTGSSSTTKCPSLWTNLRRCLVGSTPT